MEMMDAKLERALVGHFAGQYVQYIVGWTYSIGLYAADCWAALAICADFEYGGSPAHEIRCHMSVPDTSKSSSEHGQVQSNVEENSMRRDDMAGR